jgi:membrane protein implicated in regulation of membrane protease activity
VELAGILAVVAFVVVLGGGVLVRYFRARLKARIHAVDVGFRVTLESWVNQSAGLARVHYRGALWEAKVLGEPGSGTTFYIRGVKGGTLHVAPER